jgi:hypothetical protein
MLESPFTLILSGATGSGKTQWLLRFIKNSNKMIEPPPKDILYCYGEANPAVLGLRNEGIEIFHGVPDEKIINAKEKPLLLILDDLLLNINNDFLDLLFTRGSHNWNVSVVFVTQSLYGKNIRTARANAHYLVLMRNPSGQLQTRTLGSQLFPKRLNYFLEAYNDATSEKFSYLLINMHPNAPEYLRLSTNIFPDDKKLEIYMPLE